MERKKIERINELARKSKVEILTIEEIEEQKALREEYIMEIRLSFGSTLEHTVIQRPDGTKEPLKKKNK